MPRRVRRPQKALRPRLQVERLEDRLTPSFTLGQQPGAPNNTQFHGDAAHTGFNSVETVLTPANVAAGFGQVWQSPQLDGAVYATPLFLDSLLITGAGNAANHAGDTADYNTVTAMSDVDVNPATPVLTWANPADITDGTSLSATQLNATANVPGTFTYTPAAGTVLAPGQHQALGVVFSPTDTTNYNVTGATAYLNVNYGPAARLAFLQQPSGTSSDTAISPAVRVAVEDAAGSVLPTDTSTVTLTLSSGGTFTGGGTTVSAQAVAGVATFSTLAVANNGTFTLTASDGTLTTAVSNTFTIGATAFDNFNSGASSFTTPFATNLAGVAGGTALNWSATAGIGDQAGGAAGGGIVGTSTDETAVYTSTTFNLSDGAVHTISEFVTAPVRAAGDRTLQLGFLTARTAGFNGGFSFISARVYGDHRVEFQSGNGSGTAAVSTNTTAATGTIATGDWLQLVFTTRETASGSFTGTFSLLDYGPTGTAAPTLVLAPVSYTVTGLTTVGTAASMYAGFRTANSGGTATLAFDNFLVDSTAAKLAFLQQPSSGTAGAPLGAFVAAVEDINSNILVGDTSTVTLTLSHDTLANGQTTVTAQALDGMATFSNLVINKAGSYVLRATDANPNLDPGFAPFTISPAVAAKLAFTQQPSNATAGAAIAPAVTVAVQDTFANTVTTDTSTATLTLSGGTFAGGGTAVSAAAVNGVATFSNLVINAAGSYTLTAGDGSLTGATSTSFTISAGAAVKLAFLQQPSNAAPGATITPAVTVAVQDASGNTVTGNTSTVTLTLSGGTFASGSSTVSAAAVNGVATFGSLVINTAGTYTLATSDGTLTGATSASFAIVTGTATKLAFLQQPSNTTAGAAISPAVTVAVQDASGNTVTGNSSTVTLTLSGGTFAGGGTTVSVAAVNGVATFSNLVINTASSYTLAASDGTLTGATSSAFTITAGAASRLAFVQQPSNTTAGAAITPAVTVAVKDANGNTVTGNTSTVTLTLSGGTFAGGSSTASAAAVNGVATFGSLVINTASTYTLAAGDGTLTGATSASFAITTTAISVNFNAGASTFTSNFTLYNNGGANNTSLSWGAAFGVQDQPGPAAGGGVQSSGSVAIDTTAVYTPATANLSDGQVHTMSMYVTAVSGLGSGDKPLQIGYLAPTSTGFNAGFSFISARILGNNTAEFQYDNGTSPATSTNNTRLTGTITAGDWLKLVFTTRETASGSFTGTFAVIDYGPTGMGTGTTVLSPVTYSVTGLTTLGTASAVKPGFRTATSASFTGHVRFDNFADPVAPAGGQQVSLAGSFNRAGIVRDGSTFTGGLDGGGAALSGDLLGTSQTSSGTQFSLGAAGGNNVIAAVGQTISLPAGNYTTLNFLATAVNGNQPNQTFVVTYTDGTTDTFVRGISDWFTPQAYAGESDALDLAYRDLAAGARDNRAFHVYEYSLSLRPGKTVQSIRLPTNGNVNILAMSLV